MNTGTIRKHWGCAFLVSFAPMAQVVVAEVTDGQITDQGVVFLELRCV